MKSLIAFAFVGAVLISSAANAGLLMKEGRQNFLYYFGDPCPCKVEVCKTECPKPCDPCGEPVSMCDPCA